MNGEQHLLIGTVTTGLGLWLVHTVLDVQIESSTTLIALGVAGIGSLAPDIDHPRATISRGLPRELLRSGCGFLPFVFLFVIFPVLSRLLNGEGLLEIIRSPYNNNPIIPFIMAIGIIIVLIGLFLLLTSAIVSGLFRHRGATHSLIIAICATGLAIIVSMYAGLAGWYGLIFGWGYLTHLLADATTEMGLPDLFWPVSRGW